MNFLRTIFLLTLLISPLLSLTGGNEFSTGLNLAAILNLPSLNSINYLLQTAFFIVFIALNGTRGALNIWFTFCFLVFFVIFFPRHATLYSFIGLISIFSCFLLFMHDRTGITNLSRKDSKRLFTWYTIYIAVSVIAHFVIATSGKYFANDRMMGIFKNPNQLGFFLVAYYLVYIMKIRRPGGSRWDYLLPVLILFLLVLTGSRSALAAMVIIHIAHFVIIRKWSYLLSMALLLGSLLIMAAYYLNEQKLIEMISRRPANALEDVGNMRFKIFIDTFEESSATERLFGRDVSIGTNGMIFEQKRSGKQIIWLDNLLNVLFYNWGFVGLLFLGIVLFMSLAENYPIIRPGILITAFFSVAAFFFVLSDFFPLAFILIYLKTNRTNDVTSEVFSHNSVLQ